MGPRTFLVGLVVVSTACGRIGFVPGAGGLDADGRGLDADGRGFDADGGGFVGGSEAYVKASNADGLDRFGYSLAIAADGNTLTATATGEASNARGIDGDQTSNAAMGAGAAYVFTRVATGWVQQAYVKSSNEHAGDAFGIAVALSATGDRMAVGAFLEPSGATGVNGDQLDSSQPYSGAVYVFTRSAGVWTQEAYVKASNTQVADEFGDCIALSDDGNTLAVAAYTEDGAAKGVGGSEGDGAIDAGAAYVFARSGGTWSQQAYVKASNTEADDQFGAGLALSGDGDTLVVTARNEDSAATGVGGDQEDNTAPNSGAAYVFVRTGVTWTQQAYVKASNTDGGDHFGTAGTSLSLSRTGDVLAVGASSEASGVVGDGNDNSAAEAGATYVFRRTGGAWAQEAYVKATNIDAGDQFGLALSLSADGETLAVGANGEASSSVADPSDNSRPAAGAVYVYEHVAGGWSPRAYVKASNADANDQLGRDVGLSQDGHTLAVGAPNEAGAQAAGPADNSASGAGAVYIFE